MQSQHQQLVWQLILAGIAAGSLGLLFGWPMLFVSVFLIIYIIITLRNIFRLHSWFLKRDELDLPDAHGIWGELYHELYLMQKESRGNRQHLTNMLTRFQDAAAALPDGMVILTKRNKIEWANPAAARMLSIAFPRDVGQPVTNLIRHPEFLKYLMANNFGNELQLVSQIRVEHVLSVQVIPYGSSQKLLICRDITHVHKLEEMRSRFVANVSHELRSPITVLSGYLETIQGMSGRSVDDLQQPLTTMADQVDRMERLVTDLLTLSRLETEPVKFTNNVVDIPAMLAAMKEAAGLLSGEKQHQINFSVEPDLQLLGNFDELSSLFNNLISNAIRYTPAAGKIEIKWFNDNGKAVFSVQDTGAGIAPQHIPHLTQRFYRVDVDRSRESGGTGLGLAIVKHILERHDGTLNISSELNKGSTFRCCFSAERTIADTKKAGSERVIND
ncbi:MAG: phosphate regulon sensor histidine kinase PhoR [Gammaproteobacteria bacterium]|nr:phosphate regulon sensor histidine kinase PhoR [Gammaproteobacteria bacterium]MDH5652148.1 phosphate regulon sensor histidine kinase PhoR [Gammaproteobacteria bacterium]